MALSSVNRVSSPRAAGGELLLAEVRPPRCSRAGRKLLEPEFDVVAVDAAPSTDARDKEAEMRSPHVLITRGVLTLVTVVVTALTLAVTTPALAQPAKPNIILIVSDDFGYGDAGAYGGGPGRGMPTPALDRLADEGMTFFSFYAQPSCTPGRAAMQTGRIPNRSGMTTVAFQGQGGGLPAAEWTLGSVMKTAGY